MPYDISADSYSSRNIELLELNEQASLLYVALELRCAVEARMKEYLDPLEHIPKAQKKEYSVIKLGRTVGNAFQVTDQVGLFTFVFKAEQDEVTLRYIPVPKRLQEIAARAGDALHFPGAANADNPAWWKRLREMIEEGSKWFAYVATGDLMGLPLLNRKSMKTSLRAFVWDSDPRSSSLKRLARGDRHVIRVAYEPLPNCPPQT